MKPLWRQLHAVMDYTDCWRRKSQIQFHVVCPGRKHIFFLLSSFCEGWTRCFVNKSRLLTSILQSKRSNVEFWSSFIIVGRFLRHKSINVSRNSAPFITGVREFINNRVPCTTLPVQHKEKDGDDDSDQQSQTNSQTCGQHVCRHRETWWETPTFDISAMDSNILFSLFSRDNKLILFVFSRQWDITYIRPKSLQEPLYSVLLYQINKSMLIMASHFSSIKAWHRLYLSFALLL